MKQKTHGDRFFWLGCGLVGIVLLILVFRCERAVTSVVSTHSAAEQQALAPASSGGTIYAMVAMKDSLIASAGSVERDPFLVVEAPKPKPAPRKARPAKKRRLPAPPRLTAILFEEADPMVKITVGSTVSGWLRNGEVYKGWTIVKIEETTVEVHDKHRTVNLSAR